MSYGNHGSSIGCSDIADIACGNGRGSAEGVGQCSGY